MVSESKVRVISLLGMLFKADLIGVCVCVWVGGRGFIHSFMHANIYITGTKVRKQKPTCGSPGALISMAPLGSGCEGFNVPK